MNADTSPAARILAPETLTESDMLQRLVKVGEGLAKMCNQVDQPPAASYILAGLDLLRASADLTEIMEQDRLKS